MVQQASKKLKQLSLRASDKWENQIPVATISRGYR